MEYKRHLHDAPRYQTPNFQNILKIIIGQFERKKKKPSKNVNIQASESSLKERTVRTGMAGWRGGGLLLFLLQPSWARGYASHVPLHSADIWKEHPGGNWGLNEHDLANSQTAGGQDVPPNDPQGGLQLPKAMIRGWPKATEFVDATRDLCSSPPHTHPSSPHSTSVQTSFRHSRSH